MKRILPVVEGDGDLLAVPELARRVLHDLGHYDVAIARPHKRGDLPKVLGRFEDYFKVALLEGCPILWVMDYDCEDCKDPKMHIEQLRARAKSLAQGTAFEFVFMVQEFETLFLADHETTRQVLGNIADGHVFPSDPELIRDAKGWISKARPKGSAYKPTQHQQKLASQVNLVRLRARSPSFERFHAAVQRLARE